MMRIRYFTLALLAGVSLAACDVVRFPGDGGPPPETPEAGPALPPGAPGPPPPSTPVEDPYGTGDTTPDDIATDAGDAGAQDPVSPVDDSDTDVSTDTDEPDDTPVTPPSDDAATTPTDTSDADATDTGAPTDTDTDADAGTADTAPDPTPIDAPTTEPEPIVEPVFSYNAPGLLLPGSGRGQTEQVVHAPEIVFPIKSAPAYLQSMVFTFGGGIGGGDQCDARNYEYPWRDNFCETRSANRKSPFCPTARIHQGQDIRVGTPQDCNTLRRTSAADRALHEVVAVEDGVISNVGTYSVNLRAGGHIYKYMHLNMKKLAVKAGDQVTAGQTLGYVSNDFGGTATTFHLHFEIVENTAADGWAHVPPYLSLVEAYERRENGVGEQVEANVAVASAPVIIPEGFEIVE